MGWFGVCVCVPHWQQLTPHQSLEEYQSFRTQYLEYQLQQARLARDNADTYRATTKVDPVEGTVESQLHCLTKSGDVNDVESAQSDSPKFALMLAKHKGIPPVS
jgi:hypothetical protein